jgi:hypothetical protein
MTPQAQVPETRPQPMPAKASTIRYEGAKEARVPLPIVVVCFVALAAALVAARHLLGA